jgi:hypothetical protein
VRRGEVGMDAKGFRRGCVCSLSASVCGVGASGDRVSVVATVKAGADREEITHWRRPDLRYDYVVVDVSRVKRGGVWGYVCGSGG